MQRINLKEKHFQTFGINMKRATFPLAIFRSWHHFLFLDNIWKKIKENLSKVWKAFEKIMENGAFAQKEQMLLFP